MSGRYCPKFKSITQAIMFHGEQGVVTRISEYDKVKSTEVVPLCMVVCAVYPDWGFLVSVSVPPLYFYHEVWNAVALPWFAMMDTRLTMRGFFLEALDPGLKSLPKRAFGNTRTSVGNCGCYCGAAPIENCTGTKGPEPPLPGYLGSRNRARFVFPFFRLPTKSALTLC